LSRGRASAVAPSHGTRGFTLIELLIAVTLLALLAVLLFGGLRFGTRATRVGTAQLEWSAEIAAATGFLRAQFAGAQALAVPRGGGATVVSFTGDSDSVELVTLPPAYLARGGWHKLAIGVEHDRAGDRLVVRLQLIHADGTADASEAPRRSVLIDGVSAVEFGYFGAPTDRDTPQWRERWRDANHLPALVRLHLIFADRRHLPDLVVALRAAPPTQGLP
jgi:general secretion pathway protein J